MKIICLECHRELGKKFPFNDPSETHTICDKCMEKRLIEGGKKGLRRKFVKTVGRDT